MKTKPFGPQSTFHVLLAEDDEELRVALAKVLREKRPRSG